MLLLHSHALQLKLYTSVLDSGLVPNSHEMSNHKDWRQIDEDHVFLRIFSKTRTRPCNSYTTGTHSHLYVGYAPVHMYRAAS